ncbi:MAG TPA: CADD family putative folate metabolism protein [Candidatus Diapherotrites archaeon]|uniref:CADD family putative folate metabolism protein n=1 Tax=Candidatus Iainarchaeum sp. TaxID=3101447 RepID=A0A7J4JLL6_9ARCH|nr:CADD family putative folate metabolism protein [Candidatus Diapherotrites archaeon]HIH16156.1 CADD family putative folate metabolism protein [Candidatus Diapherotrites archaeon]
MTAFIQAIEEILVERSLTRHPFYQVWSQGGLSRESLREYARQYYHLERAFPAYLQNLLALAPSEEARQAIRENLRDELGQNPANPKPHTRLWLDFAEGLGLNEAQATTAVPIRETAAEVNAFTRLTKGSYLEGLAALLAYEAMLPAVSESKMDGLRKFYGLSDAKSLGFFSTHAIADVQHSNAWRHLLAEAVQSKEDEAKAIQAVNQAVDAMWGFLDGVMQQFVPAEAKAMC